MAPDSIASMAHRVLLLPYVKQRRYRSLSMANTVENGLDQPGS